MITVSESSAKVTRRARTGQRASTRNRSSAALNDTHRHTNVRRISVHTEEVTGSIPVSPTQVRGLINDLAARFCAEYSSKVLQ
jgi:hypothetical protein